MTPEEVRRANALLVGAGSDVILHWCSAIFRRPALATSFGPNSGVLWHMAHEHFGPDLLAVYVDPGDLPEANKRYRDTLMHRWPLRLLNPFEPDPPATAHERALMHAGGTGRELAYERTKLLTLRLGLRKYRIDGILFGARADQGKDGTERLSLSSRAFIARKDGRTGAYPNRLMTHQDSLAYLVRHDIPFHESGPPGGGRVECGIHTKETLP